MHRSLAPDQLRSLVVHEADTDRVIADFGAASPHPEHQVGARMHRGESSHPDVLEDAQHGELPVLIDQRVIREHREVDLHLRTRELI